MSWFTRTPFFKPKPSSFLYRTSGKILDQSTSVVEDTSSDEKSSTDDSLLSENEIRSIRARRNTRSPWCWVTVIVLHLALLAAYVATLLSYQAEIHRLRKYGPQLVDSPANDAVEWESHRFTNNDNVHGPFSGPPRDEVDKNWHDLINPENILLEPEFMERLGRDEFGVAAPDGSGFLGTLNVYHELHCIKRLYQYTYPEFYPRGDTPAAEAGNRIHADHCFDFLRQSAMCHGDVGVITFHWSPDSLVPVANSTFHQCANWNKIEDWAKARTVNMMKPNWLTHPTKGPAYPHSEEWH